MANSCLTVAEFLSQTDYLNIHGPFCNDIILSPDSIYYLVPCKDSSRFGCKVSKKPEFRESHLYGFSFDLDIMAGWIDN